MNPDASNSRALGVGERIEIGDYARPIGTDDTFVFVNPWDECCGQLVTEDDMIEYRRAIASSDEQSAANIAASLGIETAMGRKALEVALDNIRLLDSKQKDYGSTNISGFGEYGVLVRATDKLARLRNLLTNVSDPKNESVLDSWVDLANYATIAILCRKGEWR